MVRRCLELCDQADAKEKSYDHDVCLIDRDQHATIDAAVQLAGREGLLVLCTNLKFELWLIWHTEQKTVSQSSKGLDRRMRTLRLCPPKDPKHLDGHFPFDGVDRAVEYARSIDPEMAGGRVGPDPSSAMPLLVDLIRRG